MDFDFGILGYMHACMHAYIHSFIHTLIQEGEWCGIPIRIAIVGER